MCYIYLLCGVKRKGQRRNKEEREGISMNLHSHLLPQWLAASIAQLPVSSALLGLWCLFLWCFRENGRGDGEVKKEIWSSVGFFIFAFRISVLHFLKSKIFLALRRGMTIFKYSEPCSGVTWQHQEDESVSW